ncbi:MAG TPA: AMP-binding protein [Desulfuromonadales bacterium]|nr:AMP-binding protein [Desulfuromonadales bacterium]
MSNDTSHNHTVEAVPASLRELLELRGREQADTVFIFAPEHSKSLTYGAYRTAVFELAAVLGQQGLKRGGRVALLLANGLNPVVAILAVMAAGGVAVPINPRLTGPEIHGILTHSGAELLLSDRNHGDSVQSGLESGEWCDLESPEEGNGYRVLQVREPAATGTAPETELPLRSEDPALILYTSGTTGHPKGVVLSHGNLLANAQYIVSAHRLTAADRALCVLPLFHINGLVVTLLAPLLSAGSVVMPERFKADRFWGWLHDYQATWFSAVPTIFSILLSHQEPPRNYAYSLRFARSASAPLPVAVLEEFEQRYGIPVIETYGISEAACQVTANPLPPLPHKPGSAGMPVGNELLVVDEQGVSQPPGDVGEVLIRGKNIFSGYLNNRSADREALRNGWFHTGDLGYLDQDGYLFLTGRKKEQINRSGEKISPREVEEVIHRLPDVESVGVVGLPHQLYGEEVAAFITLRPGRKLEPERIREHCRLSLAAFKIPREIIFIDELPKGPSGKIQRRKLVETYQQITSHEEKESSR